MKYSKGQRAKISTEAKGKVVQSLEYDEEDDYWVMTFTDGSEISFKFMAELYGTLQSQPPTSGSQHSK